MVLRRASCLALLLVPGSAFALGCQYVLDQSYTDPANAFSNNSQTHAQTYTAGLNGTLAALSVDIGVLGSWDVRIRDGQTGSGALLSSVTQVFSASGGTFEDILLNTGVTQTAGHGYTLELFRGAGAIGINTRNPGAYAGGSYLGAPSGMDYRFKTWILAPSQIFCDRFE